MPASAKSLSKASKHISSTKLCKSFRHLPAVLIVCMQILGRIMKKKIDPLRFCCNTSASFLEKNMKKNTQICVFLLIYIKNLGGNSKIFETDVSLSTFCNVYLCDKTLYSSFSKKSMQLAFYASIWTIWASLLGYKKPARSYLHLSSTHLEPARTIKIYLFQNLWMIFVKLRSTMHWWIKRWEKVKNV